MKKSSKILECKVFGSVSPRYPNQTTDAAPIAYLVGSAIIKKFPPGKYLFLLRADSEGIKSMDSAPVEIEIQ